MGAGLTVATPGLTDVVPFPSKHRSCSFKHDVEDKVDLIKFCSALPKDHVCFRKRDSWTDQMALTFKTIL